MSRSCSLKHYSFADTHLTCSNSYQDEPRVVFDVRNPSARSRAWNLTDTQAFRQNPSPLSDFFVEQGNCIFPNSPTGLFERTNEEDAFLIAAVSMGFSTDLRMVISQVSPFLATVGMRLDELGHGLTYLSSHFRQRSRRALRTSSLLQSTVSRSSLPGPQRSISADYWLPPSLSL